jgi:hypothetical protein
MTVTTDTHPLSETLDHIEASLYEFIRVLGDAAAITPNQAGPFRKVQRELASAASALYDIVP